MQVKNIKLENNSKIKTFKLTIQEGRPGKIFVGSKETNSYLIIDDYWKSFIDLLNKGLTVGKISEELTKKDPSNFDTVRSLSKTKMMLIYFIQNKLIKEIDGEVIYKSKEKDNLKDLISKTLFLVIITPIIIFAAISIIALPRFFPKPNDFFWSNYYSLCILSSFIFTWVAAFMHEVAHLIIARAYKVKGKLRLSHRLNYLVVETYFPNIYSIPKGPRILIYISGMITDMALISILYWITFLHNFPLVRQFILLEWLSILWQFFFFMKTDMYFVIKEFVGIENLYRYANLKIINLFKLKKTKLMLSKEEDTKVNIYTVFVLAGTAVALFRYGFYHLPILITLIIGSIYKILVGAASGNKILLLDGGVVLLVEVILNLLLLFTFLKRRR